MAEEQLAERNFGKTRFNIFVHGFIDIFGVDELARVSKIFVEVIFVVPGSERLDFRLGDTFRIIEDFAKESKDYCDY